MVNDTDEIVVLQNAGSKCPEVKASANRTSKYHTKIAVDVLCAPTVLVRRLFKNDCVVVMLIELNHA